jgi:excisionase family DNA binding protein
MLWTATLSCVILWNMGEQEYLTPDQAAEKLQIHPKTVRRLLNEGKLPGQRVGGRHWRISAASLRNYIEGGQELTPKEPAASPEKTTSSNASVRSKKAPAKKKGK